MSNLKPSKHVAQVVAVANSMLESIRTFCRKGQIRVLAIAQVYLSPRPGGPFSKLRHGGGQVGFLATPRYLGKLAS